MKLLLDSCLSGGVVAPLKIVGHDVVWAGDWPADRGDDEILARGSHEGHILITLDKDFGQLAMVQEQAHAGIIRLVILSASQQTAACVMALKRYGAELQSGAIPLIALSEKLRRAV